MLHLVRCDVFPKYSKCLLSMDSAIYLLGIFILLLLFWCYESYKQNHFSRCGVQSLPAWPFFGHMMRIFFQREHFKDLLDRTYNAYPEERFVGVYQFFKRMILISDLDLIKQVAIKDFDHFIDHFGIVDEDVDPLFGGNLVALKGQKWRDMRSTLSPAFTSAKMRNMFEFVAECGVKMAEFYTKEMEKPENLGKGVLKVEMKDAFTRYANDVIATIAFGITVDSHSARDNYFYKLGKETADFGGIRMVKFFIFMLSPWVSKFLGITMLNTRLCDFYRNLVNDSMKAREDGNISRPDMIQLLMEAKKGSLTHDHESDVKVADAKETGFAAVEESSVGKSKVVRKWSDDDIVAQAVVFFVAGFDTSSTLIALLAYEMAVNPDIQTRLQEEIDEVLTNGNHAKVDYNDLQSMKYMDMVVSETLRLWPPAVATDRRCVKQYTISSFNNSPDNKEYTMNVGDGIWVPIWAIHHDPKYYPNPYKFDPERFSDANKGSIQPFTYMPFGVGPRSCIGSRFVLMETKAVVFHLLAKFDFTVISETQIPLKIAKNTFSLYSERGMWIGLKPRSLKGF